MLCDVSRVITLFSGGAFGGSACAVSGAFGFELVGIAGEISTLVGALVGVVLTAFIGGGIGYESVKPGLMSTQRLGFGPPPVGGIYLFERLDADSEPLGGGHEEEAFAPLGIAIIAGHGDYDAVLIDPASLTEIDAMLIAPLECCGALWGDDGMGADIVRDSRTGHVACVDVCFHGGSVAGWINRHKGKNYAKHFLTDAAP